VVNEGARTEVDQIAQLYDDVGHKQNYDGPEHGFLISFPLILFLTLEPKDDQDQGHQRSQEVLVDQ
jgi:hypothetical protein